MTITTHCFWLRVVDLVGRVDRRVAGCFFGLRGGLGVLLIFLCEKIPMERVRDLLTFGAFDLQIQLRPRLVYHPWHHYKTVIGHQPRRT